MTDQETLIKLANGEIIQNLVFSKSLILDFKESDDLIFSEDFNFINCVFVGRFSLKNLSTRASIKFIDCKFNSEIVTTFSELELNFMEFENCFFDRVFIKNVSGIQLDFLECLSHRITIYGCKLDNLLLTNDDTEGKGTFFINSPEIDTLYVEARSKIDKLDLSAIKTAQISGNINHVNLRTNKFDTISINNNDHALVSSHVKTLHFLNSNFEGNLRIENTEIDILYFTNLISANGSIRMNEVSIKNTYFNDCSVSNFYWNQVRFVDAPEIIRCDLSNLKMSNVYWKNSKRLKDSFLDESIPLLYGLRLRFNLLRKTKIYSAAQITGLKYQRDTYRQLKAASLANHNQIDALAFYTNEMKLYWKEVRIEGGEKWYDRILIFLSRCISNFGQNWFTPLLCLVGTHFIFVMCIFEWNYHVLFEEGVTTRGFWGEYFQMLNPIHKLPDYIVTDGGKIADFFMRIFGGYFIYHFIKASRKFLEK